MSEFEQINKLLDQIEARFDSAWVSQEVNNVRGDLYELRKAINEPTEES